MRTKWISAAALALLIAAGAAAPVAGADLEQLRERAQRLGDNVSELERDLAKLNETRADLSDRIADLSAEIGILEEGVNDAEQDYDEALDRYIDRAIEAYKSGPAEDLALILSTTSLDDMFTVVEAQRRSAADDLSALELLEDTKEAAERLQAEIDERKQLLLRENAQVTEVATAIEQRLSIRSELLADLTSQVDHLEERALAAAADAANPDMALLDLLQPSGPAPDIPDDFIGTGVTFSGIASWYGPGFEGNSTANGDIFDPSLYTAASRDLPFGTWLHVTHNGAGVVVLINDRGPYIDDRILDLSQAAAEAIGISGLGWIEAEILLKKD